MVAGEVCRGFFQELELHFLFPRFPLELAQPRTLIHGQRRLFAGMLTAVGGHPVTEGAFVNTELLRHAGNRTRGLDHHLHGFLLEFGREALLRSRQLLHLSRRPSYWMDCPEASGHPLVMLERGVLAARGLTPSAARTVVPEVVTESREYHVTSSSPAAVAVRTAGMNASPPWCGVSSTTGACWTGRSERSVKLCSRMSP